MHLEFVGQCAILPASLPLLPLIWFSPLGGGCRMASVFDCCCNGIWQRKQRIYICYFGSHIIWLYMYTIYSCSSSPRWICVITRYSHPTTKSKTLTSRECRPSTTKAKKNDSTQQLHLARIDARRYCLLLLIIGIHQFNHCVIAARCVSLSHEYPLLVSAGVHEYEYVHTRADRSSSSSSHGKPHRNVSSVCLFAVAGCAFVRARSAPPYNVL